MRPVGPTRPGRLGWWAGAVGAMMVALATTGAMGAFNSSVGNANTAGSGTLVTGVSANSVSCTSSGDMISSDQQTCPTPLLPEGSIPAPSATLTGAATVTDVGSLSKTRLSPSGVLAGPSCGPLGVSDASGNGNPGVVYGGVTGAAGPFNGSQSLSFDGSTGNVQTANSITGPSPVTEIAWFKTTGQGTILSFTTAQGTTTPTGFDRQLWIDAAGDLVYGVYPNGYEEVVSTAAYNTGQWYFVAASVGPAGQEVYVDGVLAAPINTGATSAQADSGWFHLGWGYETGWADAPGTSYFGGAIADAAAFAAQLTTSQVQALYAAGTSESAFSAAVRATTPTPTVFWPLQNSGYVYPGVIAPQGSVFPDASGNGNTGIGQAGVTQGAPGPYSGALAASFDGNGGNGYVETTNSTNPQVLSLSVWFNTTTSGGLIGMTNLQNNAAPTDWDRSIWVDPSGQVVYGDYPGSAQEVVSPGSYNNGAWHLAVAEVGPAGEMLYVDGVLVATNAGDTAPQSYVGWWHLGVADTQGWPNSPSNYYLIGSLADVAVYGTQLSSTQVASLWTAGSQSAESAAVLSLSPTSFWTLGQYYYGVCLSVGITIQETIGSATTCLVPAAAGACPALTGSGDQTLESLVGSGVTLQPLGGGSTATLTFALVQEGSIPAGYVGLHPTLALSLSLSVPGWVATDKFAIQNLVL